MADLYDYTERLKLLLYGYHGKSKINTRHFDDNCRLVDQFAQSIEQNLSDETTTRKQDKNELTGIIAENKKLFDDHTVDAVAHLTTEERQSWNDKYTRNEVDNKFSMLETSIDWKEAVETYDDLAAAYPEPQDGWTANVKDSNYTYRWSGSEWLPISANAIPKATAELDGLLSKEDKALYDSATGRAHEHSNKAVLDKITQVLLDTWNTVNDKLPLSGGTLTGDLTLKGSPTADLMAATKKYVDDSVGASIGGGDMLKSIYDTDGDGIVDNAEKVNGLTVLTAVPTGAVFTDTIYTHPTTSGNKHIPAGGAAGQILRWYNDGTAAWGTGTRKLVNVTVTAASFVASGDFTQYPYHADIAISDVTANDYAEVNPAPASKALGVLAPDNQTFAGKLRIYATGIPSTNIVLSTIVYERID